MNYKIIYYTIWLSIVTLYGIGPDVYSPLSVSVYVAVFVLPLLAFLFSLLIPVVRTRSAATDYFGEDTVWYKILYSAWLLLSLGDLAFSGFIPLLSANENNYAEFGTKGLAGFINAIAFVVCPQSYILYRRHTGIRSSVCFVAMVVVLIWQIITFRRGTFVLLLVQLFIVSRLYLSTRDVVYSPLYIIRNVCIVFGMILLFGAIGDIRGNPNPFISLFSGRMRDTLEWLPSGFTWVYVYATSGLSNLTNNINSLTEANFYFYPINSVLPSIWRMDIKAEYVLYDQNLNIGTFYSGLLLAGFPLSVVYLTVVIYCYEALMRTYRLHRSAGSAIAYSVVLLCVMITPFSDIVFLPTYLLAIIVATFIPFVPPPQWHSRGH